jgi:hypothetical protein
MTLLKEFTDVLSFVIAFSSLIIALVALKIARKTFLYSSKDYLPVVNFKILKEESIEIVNNSPDLYKIDYINYIKINTLGFEDYNNGFIVEIPFIVKSIQYGLIEKIEGKKTVFNFDSAGPCAYICPYNAHMINSVRQKIAENYSMESKKGYALPSLQGVLYIIEIVFSNNFLERDSLIFKQEHMHGLGFDKTKISTETLNGILTKSNIPKFEDPDKLWSYIIKRFSIPIEKYFGK